VRFSDIKVPTVLLSLALVYDVFWVFISPLLFSGMSLGVRVRGLWLQRLPQGNAVIATVFGCCAWVQGFRDDPLGVGLRNGACDSATHSY
jgi:hypothetical protein